MTISTKAIMQIAKDKIDDINPAILNEFFSDFEKITIDAIADETEKTEKIAAITTKMVIQQDALIPSRLPDILLLRFINNPNGKFTSDRKRDNNPNIKVLLDLTNKDTSYLLSSLYSGESFISALKPLLLNSTLI